MEDDPNSPSLSPKKSTTGALCFTHIGDFFKLEQGPLRGERKDSFLCKNFAGVFSGFHIGDARLIF